VKRLSTLIDDAAERQSFTAEALRLVPPIESAPPVPPTAKSAALASAPPPTKRLVPPVAPKPLVADAKAPPMAPAPDPNAKAKNFVMYRGRKIEVDE